MIDIRSSHYVYIVLNSDGTLYCDKNGDNRIYKTKFGLKSQIDKFSNKKVAIFQLVDVQKISEIFK